MFKKERKVPLPIRIKEALLRRLPPCHRKRPEIELNLQKRWAGYRGEQNLDYHLSFLPEKEYTIIPDLCLQVQDKTLQIDTLVITPRLIFIVESKNFQGTLFLDQLGHRFIRKQLNKEESFSDPILQAKRHRTLFCRWLQIHGLKPCPVESLVAIANPATLLETNPGQHQIFQKLMHAERIPDQIQLMESNYQETIFTRYLINKLADRLLVEHAPKWASILEKYGIPYSDLPLGVQCPQCSCIPMQRIYSTWYCPNCRHRSKTSHCESLEDYLLLHGRITQKKCRDYLQINSKNLSARLLNEMKLPSEGQARAKTYLLNLELYK